MLSDLQFLAYPLSKFPNYAIYLYRKESWILKSKVKRYVLALAQDRGWFVRTVESRLDATIAGSSLFDIMGAEQIVVCDIGEDSARHLQSDDVEGGLCSIAAGHLEKRVFLMVPSDHSVLGTDSWVRAIASSHVAYIEEPIVTRANFAELMKSFTLTSDLSKLGQLARTRAFRDYFSRFIPEKGCTLSEISMEIDRFALLPMTGAASQKLNGGLAVRRRTIDIVQKSFLDRRNEAALSEILVHLDGLLFTSMLDRSEVIARLYTTTASIVGSRDKRRKNRDIASLGYYVWGMLLLSCDWSDGKYDRGGVCLLAFERICREFMTILHPRAWLRQTDRWQRIAAEIAQPADAERGKLERARLDLIDALRERSALLGVSHSWLEFSVVNVA